MSHNSPPATVLVVDDEQAYVDAYTSWLDGHYNVRTASSGKETLRQLSDDIDVILLDRRMPGLSGDDVLTEIRDRNIDCQISLVTAVEPEVNVVELGFDDYLVKPVSQDELRGLVENLLLRATFDKQSRECFTLAAKLALLESNIALTKLVDTDEYKQLKARFADAEQQATQAIDDLLDEGDIIAAYRAFE